MDPFMIPDQSFPPYPEIHFPKAIGWSFLREALEFLDQSPVIAVTLVRIYRSGKVHDFAGPTEAYLIRLSEVINARAFLSGP